MSVAELMLESLGRPAELLLVEDNYGDVLLTREACRKAKMPNNLSVAGDGEEALSMLRREGRHADHPRPDLILLDLNLPRMDGREVLHTIKSDPALQRIPVFVLTSSAAEIDVCKSYDLKANSYIVKPVEFDRLQEIVASTESFWIIAAALPTGAAEQSSGR
jgi:two-component system, chemotaxis family, response regulator Rcp1